MFSDVSVCPQGGGVHSALVLSRGGYILSRSCLEEKRGLSCTSPTQGGGGHLYQVTLTPSSQLGLVLGRGGER